MAKCYIHSKKSASRGCSECGKPICNDCTFEEVVRSRTTRYSRIDRVVEMDYEFYCPHCYLDLASRKGYDKSSRGVFFRFKKSPSILLLSFLWISFFAGVIINIFFPIGYTLWIVTIISMIILKANASKNYNNYLKALKLTETKKEKPKPSKSEEIVCKNCGSPVPQGSEYCNICGNKL